jgi:hypothetical protein
LVAPNPYVKKLGDYVDLYFRLKKLPLGSSHAYKL